MAVNKEDLTRQMITTMLSKKLLNLTDLPQLVESLLKPRNVHWVAKSTNTKLGPIPASYASIEHYCPDSCKLKNNGCYAQTGRVAYTERKVREGTWAKSLFERCADITRYANIVRHRVSGDVYSPNGLNDVTATLAECIIFEGMNLINIGYTHSWRFEEVQPLKTYFRASCDGIDDLKDALVMGWSTELTVTELNDEIKQKVIQAGHSVGKEVRPFGCPAQKTNDEIDCNTCTMCKVNEKTEDIVVLFFTHGGLKKKADRALSV